MITRWSEDATLRCSEKKASSTVYMVAVPLVLLENVLWLIFILSYCPAAALRCRCVPPPRVVLLLLIALGILHVDTIT